MDPYSSKEEDLPAEVREKVANLRSNGFKAKVVAREVVEETDDFLVVPETDVGQTIAEDRNLPPGTTVRYLLSRPGVAGETDAQEEWAQIVKRMRKVRESTVLPIETRRSVSPSRSASSDREATPTRIDSGCMYEGVSSRRSESQVPRARTKSPTLSVLTAITNMTSPLTSISERPPSEQRAATPTPSLYRSRGSREARHVSPNRVPRPVHRGRSHSPLLDWEYSAARPTLMARLPPTVTPVRTTPVEVTKIPIPQVHVLGRHVSPNRVPRPVLHARSHSPPRDSVSHASRLPPTVRLPTTATPVRTPPVEVTRTSIPQDHVICVTRRSIEAELRVAVPHDGHTDTLDILARKSKTTVSDNDETIAVLDDESLDVSISSSHSTTPSEESLEETRPVRRRRRRKRKATSARRSAGKRRKTSGGGRKQKSRSPSSRGKKRRSGSSSSSSRSRTQSRKRRSTNKRKTSSPRKQKGSKRRKTRRTTRSSGTGNRRRRVKKTTTTVVRRSSRIAVQASRRTRTTRTSTRRSRRRTTRATTTRRTRRPAKNSGKKRSTRKK